VIVKPDVYAEFRSVIRMEPFLAVRGRLQKDGATMNVIAARVDAVRALPPGALVAEPSRSGPSTPSAPSAPSDPYRYLTALRQSPPGVKSWG
jgi:hypothetical protein